MLEELKRQVEALAVSPRPAGISHKEDMMSVSEIFRHCWTPHLILTEEGAGAGSI